MLQVLPAKLAHMSNTYSYSILKSLLVAALHEYTARCGNKQNG